MIEEDLDYGALFILPSDAMGGAEKVLRLVALHCGRSAHKGQVWIYVLSGKQPTLSPFAAQGVNVKVVYSGKRRAFQGVPGLIRFTLSKQFNIVMSSHTHVNALTSLLRRLRLLKTRLLVARESTMIFERDFSLPKKIALRAMYRLYGAHDRIVCQTEEMRASLNHHTGYKYAEETETIGNPICLHEIDEARSQIAEGFQSTGNPLIVWCGRFHPVKRPEIAVDTLAILRDDCQFDPHLLMIGKGPLLTEVQNKVLRLRLGNMCTFAGYQENPVALFAARTGSIGLLTSETEGFPNVILEMLAAGMDRVVVTPCCAGLVDVPGVTVASSFEPNDIAAAIRHALTTPANRASINAHLAARNINEYARLVLKPTKIAGSFVKKQPRHIGQDQ